MDEFLALGTNKSDSIMWSTKALKDGIYTFKAEGSIATNIPELVRGPAAAPLLRASFLLACLLACLPRGMHCTGSHDALVCL
jgi:hypothetical protein